MPPTLARPIGDVGAPISASGNGVRTAWPVSAMTSSSCACGYNAIDTGVLFTAATVGLLVSSLAAGRLAKLFAQRSLIVVGFVVTIAGVVVLLLMATASQSKWAFAPGLLLIGLGLGLMLTLSVNVVQSSFPGDQQGEISGLSRSVSNLGSSLGAAIAGTILVAGITATPGRSYGLALIALAAIGVVGLAAALLLPTCQRRDEHRGSDQANWTKASCFVDQPPPPPPKGLSECSRICSVVFILAL